MANLPIFRQTKTELFTTNSWAYRNRLGSDWTVSAILVGEIAAVDEYGLHCKRSKGI